VLSFWNEVELPDTHTHIHSYVHTYVHNTHNTYMQIIIQFEDIASELWSSRKNYFVR